MHTHTHSCAHIGAPHVCKEHMHTRSHTCIYIHIHVCMYHTFPKKQNNQSLINILKSGTCRTLKKILFVCVCVCVCVWFVFVFVFFNLFIYLFLAVLGLCCCAQAFSSCGEQGLLFVAVHGFLIAVASLVSEYGLQAHRLQQLWLMGFSSCGSWALEYRLSSCGARAQLLRSMWDLPRPGLEPVSPALAGGFLCTAPPGKLYVCVFIRSF